MNWACKASGVYIYKISGLNNALTLRCASNRNEKDTFYIEFTTHINYDILFIYSFDSFTTSAKLD